MKKKNNLFKNILYIFFAFCFMGVGITTLSLNTKEDISFAENVSNSQIDNQNIPDYFSAVEYLETSSEEEVYDNSLMNYDTFMYFTEGNTKNNLHLTLKTNGSVVNSESDNDLYTYVYYPDETNTSLFYFYNINSVSLYINGEYKTLNMGNFINSSGLAFANKSSAPLENFEMIFKSGATESNEIELFDESGNLIEGVYSLSLAITLHCCTDGNTTGSEEQFSDQNVNINYSFYVTDRESYLSGNRANVGRANFDNEVPVSTSTSTIYSCYLYSNFSSENGANKLPYIEYDYTRFELEISKEFQNNTKTTNFQYDLDSNLPVESGQKIVNFVIDEANNKCKIYFTDIGEYTITFKDIAVFGFKNADLTIENKKYSLDGISSITKKFMVYVYGFQASCTDMDSPTDENNIRPTEELKDFDFVNGVVKENRSADITSAFLNSNTDYSQNNNTTFLISNVLNYINSNSIAPVKTNQTPVKLTSNVTLKQGVSNYIFSTTKVSDAYTLTSNKLNGQNLYRTSFNGRTESSSGTYIYLLAYTYNNYYDNETTLNSAKTFYQVFFFEITKDLPSIEIKTEEGENVYSDTYVNKNVKILDTTSSDTFNKDVTIQIYAWDFTTKTYKSSFGGTSGINYKSLVGDEEDTVILQDNARYIVRLYFTNEITSSNILITSKTGYFREQTFTIDKIAIDGITGRNVTEITNSSDYKVLQNHQTFDFTTNQSFVLSWNEKTSGATTYAYYRYFAIEELKYYSDNTSAVSNILEDMLTMKKNVSYLPINYALNLATTNNNWLPYKGNSQSFTQKVATEYVLSDAGLYLVDVYDEAGNHTFDAFMLDKTSPIFAINDGTSFSLTSPSMYITTNSTLYWGNYKTIYIKNFNSVPFNTEYNADNITEVDLSSYDFYKTHEKTISTEIFKVMYNKLKLNNYMQSIKVSVSKDATVDSSITSYSGNYITIPINSVSYFRDDKENKQFTKQTDVYKQQINSAVEMEYYCLIRDLSNTNFDESAENEEDSQFHYTNFYSAKQKIMVSYDSSEFKISYINSKNEIESPSVAEIVEGTIEDDSQTLRSAKTTYLSPTSLAKEFTLSFLPTITDNNGLSIQVDKVTIKFYPYEETSVKLDDGTIYHYRQISKSATEINVYEYNEQNASTSYKEEPIRLNSENQTTAGKYEITRTYKIDNGFSYNDNDFYSRTFVFYVDRNEVITNSELVSDENGSHLESLVGGDIFISMYDNKTNSSLVVTFPDSPQGNINGSSLYNNGNVKSVLTTNMLPVYVYVPQYKYTTYSQMIENSEGGYEFKVNYNFDQENNSDTMNYYYDSKVIAEYAIYAEIYKNGTESSNLLAKTSSNWNNPQLSTVEANENGFLNFYLQNGSPLNYLAEAGTYYVKVFQGKFGNEVGENSYTQSITFCFDIKNSNPDFVVQSTTGSDLNTNESGDRYYTNQSKVNLIWEAGNTYMAEIDTSKIYMETSSGIKEFVGNAYYDEAPTLSNGIYVAKLNLDKLRIYNNGGWVKITMEYKNHNQDFYTKVTKYIEVDLSAPNTNIQNLVSKSTSGNIINSLTTSNLRTYYTAKMEVTSDLNNTSYNLSNNNGTFAYYSYNVKSNYIDNLKNSISSEEGYKTYIREFVGKYTTEVPQETAPAEFLSTNFNEISKVATLNPNTYYEVVEMDKAGNMTIYTIYVVDYEEDEGENSKLISYSNADGDEFAYTMKDYIETNSYNGAKHNIYAKTGFTLTNINYLGDAWAQFKLNTTNANGFTTTKYMMLTPWDKEYAYAFVGNEITKIKISDLIDGSISSRYKNCISFFNRENSSTEDFYINIRNTTISATLTDNQDREYIKFTLANDQAIQSTTYSSTFVTKLKITANGDPIYEDENKLGFANHWKSDDKVKVTADQTANTIIFEINQNLGFVSNTRIVYEYEDNYGTTYKEIHLYKETIIKNEIDSEQDLYSYYDTTTGKLIYITKDGFKFNFNPNKYSIEVFDFVGGEIFDTLDNATKIIKPNSNGTSTLTVKSSSTSNYNNSFVIDVRDLNNANTETNLVKRIYFTLYNELPIANVSEDNKNNEPGEFKLLDANRNNKTSNIISGQSSNETGYYSEITLLYTRKETFIPVKYTISTDKENWQEIASGTVLRNQTSNMEKYYLKIWYDESFLINENDNYEYVFENVPETQIYEFNLSALTSTYWIEKTIGSTTTIVEKSDTIYKSPTGKQYTNHYIINLNYTDRDYVQIKTNKEQEIEPTLIETFSDSTSVISEHWIITNINGNNLGNISPFSADIILTYIPNSDNFVDEFFTYNTNGIIDTTENLINLTSKSVVISEEYSSINKIELQWSKYYGIVQNEINIKLFKDGTEITPNVFTKQSNGKEYNYIYLTYSGKYSISLYDNAGNIQKFNRGNAGQSEALTLTFLKDVPFTVTYQDVVSGETVTTSPIKQAVYNGAISLNIDKSTQSSFYSLDGYPEITIRKNGVELTAQEVEDNYFENTANYKKYNFKESGYYEVYFTATSNLTDVGTIRKEIYQFTVMNPNEYRYSYVFNKYSNYYVEKVEKDGKDITQNLIKTLDVSTITVNKTTYLAELPLSYLDEKTGAGSYLITINSNDKMFNASSASWTFKVVIQVGTAPIKVSVAEGQSTTNQVDIIFNAGNIYQEMGECTVRILKYNSEGKYYGNVYSKEITAETKDEISTSISASEKGSFFLQVVSPSGNLLYSYKISKDEPMNFATIIIIITAVILAIIIVFIIIKLRKKISVK